MEKIMITCPFTGVEFEAIKFSDNKIVTSNKITGEEIVLTYDCIRKRYLVNPDILKYEKMWSLKESAEQLSVSKERVCALMKQGRLKRISVGNATYIPNSSLLKYLSNRKLKEDKQWSKR